MAVSSASTSIDVGPRHPAYDRHGRGQPGHTGNDEIYEFEHRSGANHKLPTNGHGQNKCFSNSEIHLSHSNFAAPASQIIAWIFTIVIVGLNARMVFSQIQEWISTTESPLFILFFILPVIAGAVFLLLYITFRPLFHKAAKALSPGPHGAFHHIRTIEVKPYKKIAVALDFSTIDQQNINNALSQGGKSADYLLLHVVESAGALVMKNDIRDFESQSDQKYLFQYAEELIQLGYKVTAQIGYGNPKKEIPRLVTEYNADLLIMGAHGHKGFKDFLFGTTVDAVRHRIKIPLLIVRKGS